MTAKRAIQRLTPAVPILLGLLIAVIWRTTHAGPGSRPPAAALVVDPADGAECRVDAGERVRIPFHVHNTGPDPVHVLGAKRSCACTVPNGLPMTIDPGQTRDVTLDLLAPKAVPPGGDVAGTVLLYVDGEAAGPESTYTAHVVLGAAVSPPGPAGQQKGGEQRP